jgi:hypothetical protein
MAAEPPEQLVPFDPSQPLDPTQIHLAPVMMTALVADPGASRNLDYTMTACPPENDGRCDPSKPSVLVGGGTIFDPETADFDTTPYAMLSPGPDLLAVIEQAAKDDPLHGFSSIDIMVEMRVNPPGATDAEAVYATKGVRFGTTTPPGRTPNHNPTATIEIDPDNGDARQPWVDGRCVEHDTTPFPIVAPGAKLHFYPDEPPGARETYVVPTFDGGSLQITENLSYTWFAGDGTWEAQTSGGPRDAFGNDPALGNHWTAPSDQVEQYVPIYVVQRDERLGEAWFESCVHVRP